MSTFDLLYLMSLFLPLFRLIAQNLTAHYRRCLLQVRKTVRSSQTTQTRNFWLRFIVALQAAVVKRHGRIILATTVRLLGEVIRLHVK